MEYFIYKGTETEGFTDREKWNYLGSCSLIDNPEYLDVVLDSSNKVIEGIQMNGMKYFGAGMNIGGNEYYVMENPEWIRVVVDGDGKVLCGIKQNGKFYADIDGIDEQVQKLIQPLINEVEELVQRFDEIFKLVDNPEYMSVELDSEEKVLGGRKIDGIKFENVGLDLGGAVLKGTNDPEGRMEIKTDSDEKIISYRKEDGTLVENVGIEANSIYAKKLSVDVIDYGEEANNDINSRIANRSKQIKQYRLPKYGNVNIKQETFYLTADSRYSDKNGIVLIQEYDETEANAQKRLTIANYYIKSTLTPTAEGGYDKTSITPNSVKLDFHAGKDVTSVGSKFFATAIYTPNIDAGGNITSYSKTKATKVVDPNTGEVIGYEVNGVSTEVTQIVDIPPYKAWKVTKEIEHYCVVDFDFGYYYKKNNVPVGVKYQGSSTTAHVKRNFRFTIYKASDYNKKNKIKIGELIRQSGFNLKANYTDPVRFKEQVMQNIFMAMWESRGKYKSYPWDSDEQPYTGATGMIKGFPIRMDIGGQFYGVQVFGLKKDENNYMLDGEESGIFVSCSTGWHSSTDWEDEIEDEMTSETQVALQGLLDFIQSDQFTRENMPAHMSIIDWIDYFICAQVFYTIDNMARNVILYSNENRTIFYPYFYDLDLSWVFNSQEEITYDLITQNRWGMNLTRPWGMFKDAYWDEIVNRYGELRNTILNRKYIQAVYDEFISIVPEGDFNQDINKWGSYYSSTTFTEMLDKLDIRFEWLDSDYFKV